MGNMFTTELQCENCGFSTRRILLSYIPDRPYDLVFQNPATNELRVVSCELPADDTIRHMSDAEWDRLLGHLIATNQRQDEVRLDLLDKPDSFRLNCPSCSQLNVRFHNCGIV